MWLVAIIHALKVAIDSLEVFEKLWKLSSQLVMSFIAVLIFWAGLNIVRERDLVRGLEVAFVDSHHQTMVREADTHSAVLQDELRRVSESNELIHKIMDAMMKSAPGADRARFAVFHNGISGLTGIGLLRYDIIVSVAGSGRNEGDLEQNRPLEEWSSFLPELLSGKCAWVDTDTIRNISARARMEEMGVKTFNACPVVDSFNRMLGAVSVYWSRGDGAPPDQSVREELSAQNLQAASRIAGAMELRR